MSDIPKSGIGEANAQGYPYGRHASKTSLESFLSKSWLFEVVDRESDNIIESFTLILPPQSYTIKEPQRVSITKTFGNAFVDDYGPDNIQITLKGITGTTHAFPTYRPKGPKSTFTDVGAAVSGAGGVSDNAEGYTGKTAFYEFRNKIMRYKNRNPNYEKSELRVYDLADEQAYKCVLLDFTVDRNSENPLRYPYTISLFVYERLDALKVAKSKDVPQISKEPITALNKVDEHTNVIDALFRDVSAIVNRVSRIKARSLELRSKWNRFLERGTDFLTAPLDISKSLLDTCFTAIGASFDTYQAGKYTFERYAQAEELFFEIFEQALRTYGFQISKGWQTTRTVQLQIDDGLSSSGDSVSRSFSIGSYQYSGLNVYTVRGEDTLPSIARNELGNENLWPYIAAINDSIDSSDDLVSGMDIFIPIKTDSGAEENKERFILTEDAARDPYGTDVKLDQDGNIVIQENGDLSLVSGLQNVQQAVDLRLNTVAGSMIKQSAFGITAQAGIAGTELAIKYLKVAIRSSLVKDPRISAVENMVVNLAKDVLGISMDIKVVGMETSLPVTIHT